MTTHSKHFCNSHKQNTGQKLQNSLLLQSVLTFSFILCFLVSFSQQDKIDSLTNELKTVKHDTSRINTLNALSWELLNQGDYEKAMQYANDVLTLCAQLLDKKIVNSKKATAYNNIGNIHYRKGDYDKALEFYFKALSIREEIGDKNGMAASYNNIGLIHVDKGDYYKALEFYFKALSIREEIGDKKGMANSYNNIGLIHWNMGDYDKALEFYFKALSIREEIRDKKGMADSYVSIGMIHYNKGDYDKALENYFVSLKIYEEIGNKQRMAMSYNNIGVIHYDKGDYDKALEFYFKALSIREEISDKISMANSYNNIGVIHYYKAERQRSPDSTSYRERLYDKALEFHFKSLSISEEIGDKKGMAVSYNNIGTLFTSQKKFSEAREYLNKGLALSKAIGTKAWTKEAYECLSQLDSTLGNWKAAYEYHKLYSEVKDSMFNEESNKAMTEMSAKYESEKKELKIENLNKDNAIKETEIKKQNIQKLAFAGGFGLMLILSFVIFRGYKQKQKANEIITSQKTEVEKQKDIVEEQKKEITDSINYAKRIQKAILPHRSDIWSALPESFVLYKPKDIVAGDFYWFYKNHETVLIAAADCTGHGVPGAFTSMICSEKLNDAVKHSSDPGEILSLTNKGIKVSLKQGESAESTKDGMDIALCLVDRKSGIVKYAGANRPLWIIRNGQTTVEEIKATKQAIGGHTNDEQIFETHTIQLQSGDTFYISSDGYADQDGGDKGKKLMTKTFKQMLIDIQDKSMKEQKEYLGNFIENWHTDRHQLDDILVIGVRI